MIPIKMMVRVALTGIAFVSCVRDVTPDFSGFRPSLVINGTLVPDSFVRINISTSLRADQEGPFPPVTDASAEISDGRNDYRLVSLGNGDYSGAFMPVSGKTYELKVISPEGKTFTATTTVPFRPEILYSSIIPEHYVRVTLRDDPAEENFYWIGKKTYDLQENRIVYEGYIESDFLLFDDFNRTGTTDRYGRNTYAYHFYARLPDHSFNGKDAVFTIPNFWIPAEELKRHPCRSVLFVISADRHLDQYLKAALVQYDLSTTGDMPVFHTPVSIYSNITKGKGIFGSYMLTELDITLP